MLRRRILISGSSGQLGRSLQTSAVTNPAWQLMFTDRRCLDFAQPDKLSRQLQQLKPDIIINTAAYTNVEQAQLDRHTANCINHLAVAAIANWCAENGKILIHISSDYVFNSPQPLPLTELDSPQPVNYYGCSKLAGEKAILTSGAQAAIIRTSWLYSAYNNNFVNQILRLSRQQATLTVVTDQFGSPTFAADLAAAIWRIAAAPPRNAEIFHYSNTGTVSRYELAQQLVQLTGARCQILPTTSAQLPPGAPRPVNSSLNCDKIKRIYGLDIASWHNALRRYLASRQLLKA